MVIEVNLSAKEFERFSRFDTLVLRKAWRPSAIFAGIMSVCAIICYAMHHIKGAVLLGNVLLIVGLGMPIVYFSTYFSSVKKESKAHGLARPQLVYTITLTEKAKGIHVDNGKEQVDFEWKNLFHVYRYQTATYLYITPQRAFLIPDTCTDVDELWALLEKKLPENKRTRR